MRASPKCIIGTSPYFQVKSDITPECDILHTRSAISHDCEFWTTISVFFFCPVVFIFNFSPGSQLFCLLVPWNRLVVSWFVCLFWQLVGRLIINHVLIFIVLFNWIDKQVELSTLTQQSQKQLCNQSISKRLFHSSPLFYLGAHLLSKFLTFTAFSQKPLSLSCSSAPSLPNHNMSLKQ